MEAHGDKMATKWRQLTRNLTNWSRIPQPPSGASTANLLPWPGSARPACQSIAVTRAAGSASPSPTIGTANACASSSPPSMPPKKEGQFVAQRIQAGMQHVTDLKPHERDHYAKAVELLGLTDHRGAGGPVVQHRAQRRPVGDDLSVGPPRPGRYPAGVRGVNAPFNPRANGKNPCLTEVYQTRNGFARAGHTAIPPAPSTCSYVQLRGKSMAEEEAYPAKTTTSNPQGWSDALSSELTDHGD